jgi:NitT/TauT family transport system substrate-binding protein
MRSLRCEAKACIAAAFIASSAAGAIGHAAAETNEIRVSGVFGLSNLPVYVAVERHLIEARAQAVGLPDVKVTLIRVSGGAAAADLLLSGNADIASAGATNLMVLWDKTLNLKQGQVRGIMALCDSPISLISVDPRIRTLRDFTDNDRIAVTSIRVSVQAIVLGMAAAKEFGWDQRTKLDPLTVAMPHEDGMAMLLSGGGVVRTQAAQLPFSVEEMDSGKAHLLLTSNEVMDGRSTLGVALTTAKFRAENPTVYASIVAGLHDALDFINQDKHEAAAIYVKYEPQKKGIEWVAGILQHEDLIKFDSVPHGTEKFTTFMFKSGLLRNHPQSWRDLYWESGPDIAGN